jgi:hypothetical protein
LVHAENFISSLLFDDRDRRIGAGVADENQPVSGYQNAVVPSPKLPVPSDETEYVELKVWSEALLVPSMFMTVFLDSVFRNSGANC